MKRRILALILTVLLAVSMLCACESTAEKYAALDGTWIMYQTDSQEQVMILLESIDLYEEEIALVDMTSLKYAWTVAFDADHNFRQVQPVEENKALVREFYEGMFNAFYEGRATIDEAYEDDLSAMTQEEFNQFYATLYSFETFEALLDQFVENAYKYDEWEDLRNGTFTIKGDKLEIVDTIESETVYIGYQVEGDTLTLTYSDGTEVYTQVP